MCGGHTGRPCEEIRGKPQGKFLNSWAEVMVILTLLLDGLNLKTINSGTSRAIKKERLVIRQTG